MDNTENRSELRRLAALLGVAVDENQAGSLLRYAAELLRWNAKVNLTAITAPMEVIEKHLVDSVAASPEVAGASSLLDLGAGAGLPGIPLKILHPTLSVQLVDAVSKKVGFIKHAAALLGLKDVRAIHARAGGELAREGIVAAEVVTARALMDLEQLAALSLPYLASNGRVVALVGAPPDAGVLAALEASGWTSSVRAFALPLSGGRRAVVVLRRST